MTGEGRQPIDYGAERVRFDAITEFQRLAAEVPDAIQMVTSTKGEEGLTGEEISKYWDKIGKGEGGFYDDIRINGCSSCDSHSPGCCDACG